MQGSEIEKLQTFLTQTEARMVDLRFADLLGRFHHVSLPISAFDQRTFAHGVAFDASSVAGFKTVEGGDMVLIPELASAVLDPFYELPTVAMICSLHESNSRAPFERDPRQIARLAEACIAEVTPLADRSLWGPEFEFYVFDHISSVNTNNRSSYTIEAVEAHWNTGEECNRHLGQRIRYQGGYHVMPPLDALHDLRSRMVELIEAAGIPVKYHHHEVGGAGQCEIEIGFLPLLEAADAIMTIKHLVRMTALKAGKTATFMPKPLTDEAGSGMHFHQMLFKDEQPVFHDPQGYAELSRTALQFIGGILTHAPALLALCNPSTNSYKRLVPGFEAPTRMFFGLANRSAAVRIPKQARTAAEKRFEFRPPDATCNPYLAMSAMLLAGLDGIRKEIDPTEAGFGPFDFNVFELPVEERDKIGSLPASLEQALDALRADSDFLLPGKVFPSDFTDVWVDLKMRHEVLPMRTRTHPYEVELYYDC
ncbi:MAG: type I glutamate--ammonia ligase [Deltaproteobacteria bacterium]|nr:type I glutamate--ammonia ligase [Deltaproteobacteria bacterium]